MDAEIELLLRLAVNALEDAIEETSQPEAAELMSMALDSKLELARNRIQEYLDNV